MRQIEFDALEVICSNLPAIEEIAKQLKIKNKIDMLRLKKDNGYAIKCGDIDDISKMLDDK